MLRGNRGVVHGTKKMIPTKNIFSLEGGIGPARGRAHRHGCVRVCVCACVCMRACYVPVCLPVCLPPYTVLNVKHEREHPNR